jgi:pimeloyl-ACP methyl ester carboxylesterase
LIKSLRPVPFWTAVSGYGGVLKALGHPDPTVLPVPYDFRRGVVLAAQRLDDRVRERLELLWPSADHRGRVIVVAHSMGGLVARYWIGVGGGSAVCRALITLGTPHWGAPKAVEVLANGIRVKGVSVLSGLRDVLRTWPGLAELLPRYRSVIDGRRSELGGTGQLWYPHEVPLPWQQWGTDPARAYRVHRDIESGWERLPRSGTAVVPRIGYGHGTLRSSVWDGSQVSVSRQPPAWPQLGRGDGTVPAFAGLPVEMAEQPPDDFLVRSRHGQLGALDEVAALVRRYEGRASLTPYRGVEHPAVLGLDLEEVHVAGEPVDISAALTGDGIEPAAAPVWMSVVDASTGRPSGIDVELEFDPATGGHRGVVPSLPAGVWTVQAAAREVPGVGDLGCEQTIEVFAGDDLG